MRLGCIDRAGSRRWRWLNSRTTSWRRSAAAASGAWRRSTRICAGVERVVSGYAGGSLENPTYEQVCAGRTGHAEVVQITFDPEVVSFRDLLDVFFTIHDPTTKDRQGADIGTQYRSVIFYHSPGAGGEAPARDRRSRGQKNLGRADRHRGRAAREILSGRGLPPGLLRAEPAPALLPDRDRAQSGEVPQGAPGTAEAVASPPRRAGAHPAAAIICLAPDIVESILDGREPKGLSLAEMLGMGHLHGRSSLKRLSSTAAVDRAADV